MFLKVACVICQRFEALCAVQDPSSWKLEEAIRDAQITTPI